MTDRRAGACAGPKFDPTLDQAAQRAKAICQIDSGRTNQSVGTELQRQVAMVWLVHKFNTLPLTEGTGNQSESVKHVDVQATDKAGIAFGHVDRCNARLLDSVGLCMYGIDPALAVKAVTLRRHITVRLSPGHISTQAFVCHNAVLDCDTATGKEVYTRLDINDARINIGRKRLARS